MPKNLILRKPIITTDNFLLLLICLVPCAIIVGPLIADLFVTIICISYLSEIIIKRKVNIFKYKLFIFFFSFYIYLLINTFLISNIYKEVWINVIFYFRFILFAYASHEILYRNIDKLKLVYIIFILTLSITLIDGYFQYFFEINTIGFKKLRPDRISGFFGDDLVLGSFLLRILPVIFFFTVLLNKNKYFKRVNISLILLTTMLIFLSGERASFFLLVIYLFLIVFFLNFNLFIKLFLIVSFPMAIILVQMFNPLLFDRYFTQTKTQIFSNDNQILPYYMPLFETAIKISNDKKFFGLGPKSFRYYCNNPKYVTYSGRKQIINNKELTIDIGWKNSKKPIILDLFVKEGDEINKGDIIFEYYYLNKKKKIKYLSNKSGLIEKIYLKKIYFNGNKLADIDPSIFNLPDKSSYKINGCSTHPHNYYLQLLSEVGYIGFAFIFGLFLFILAKISKMMFLSFTNNKISNLEVCFLSFYFVILFPLSTTGNFFNNWLNILTIYPLIFYFLSNKINKDDKFL